MTRAENMDSSYVVSPVPTKMAPPALLPCPHCGGAMQLRQVHGAWDGESDCVIHAHPVNCGMVGFSIDTDGDDCVKLVSAWNRRAGVVRMLTSDELLECCSIYHESNINHERFIEMFCEVNGLTVADHKDANLIHNGACGESVSDNADASAMYTAPPEGCTPEDAKALRAANHALAMESFEFQTILRDLFSQVTKFCEEQGEAEFETGPAHALLLRADGCAVSEGLQSQLVARLERYGVRPQGRAACEASAGALSQIKRLLPP